MVLGARKAKAILVFLVATLFIGFLPTPAEAAVPTITSLSVIYGPKSGGTTTNVIGTGFLGTTSVTVGGVAATIGTITDTAVTITTPVSATNGLKSVVLTNADGSVTYANSFTYYDTAVNCGTSGQFYISSNAVIAAVNCVGTVDVPSGVTTINGCTFGNAAGGNCGTLSGNAVTAVTLPSSIRTIAGAAFLGAGTMTSIYLPEGLQTIGNSAFYFSGKHPINIPSTVTNIDSAFYRSNVTAVTFTTPASLTSIGQSTFRAMPNLTSLVIPEGVTTLASIAVGDITSGFLKWISLPSTLTSVVTSGNTTFNLQPLTCVVNPGNTTYINGLTFPNSPTIVTDINNCQAPTLSAVSPSSGTSQGGVSTTITGTNLLTVNTVTVGGSAGSITTRTATYIIFTTPAGTVGTADITVTTFGPSATLAASYTYLASPTITSLSVTTGPVTGGTVTVITGTNLASISAATLGGSAVTRGTNTSTSLTITTPVGTVGAKNLILTNANGSVALVGAFTYYELVSSFSVFSLPGNTTATTYRINSNITATVAYASKITFYFQNIRIPGCISMKTPASAPFTVTCAWRPARAGSGKLTATAIPTTGGITTGYAIPLNVTIAPRTTLR